MTYVFVGPHPDTLANGTPIGLDQEIANNKVDLDDPHDKFLVDEGWLVKQDKSQTQQRPHAPAGAADGEEN